MQALGKRFQSLDTLRTVKECRSSGCKEIKIWKSAAVNIVYQLAQRIESLLPNVATDALQCFDFVENEHQS